MNQKKHRISLRGTLATQFWQFLNKSGVQQAEITDFLQGLADSPDNSLVKFKKNGYMVIGKKADRGKSKSMQHYDPMWTLFFSACCFEGVKNALLHFNEQDRKHYQQRLIATGKSDWWKPEEVWQGLPEALSYITNVKGNHPIFNSIVS